MFARRFANEVQKLLKEYFPTSYVVVKIDEEQNTMSISVFNEEVHEGWVVVFDNIYEIIIEGWAKQLSFAEGFAQCFEHVNRELFSKIFRK